MDIRVAALHRLPFDSKRFAKDIETVADLGDEMRAVFQRQFRENWDNAWIIVVEYPVAEKLDYSKFAHPAPGPSAQAAWLEQELAADGTNGRAVFFMHYVDPAKPLWYGDQRLSFPQVSAAPQSLIEALEYFSPD